MYERYSEDPDKADRDPDANDREFELHEALSLSRDSMFTKLQQFHDLVSLPDDLSVQIRRLTVAISKNVDAFVELSALILGREDTISAVEDWIAFVTANDTTELRRSFQIVGVDVVEPLTKVELEKYAWNYIRENNLDIYDQFGLDTRDDLGFKDWITEGYPKRKRFIVGEVLDYNLEDVAYAFRHAPEDDTLEFKPRRRSAIADETDESEDAKLFLDSYTAHLPPIVDQLKKHITSFDFGPTSRYLHSHVAAINQTAMFKAYERNVEYIHRILRSNRKSRGAEQTCDILREPAFLDGFRFAMIINSRILAPERDHFDISSLDALDAHMHDLMSAVAEQAEDGLNIDEVLPEFGFDLYDANLAHPEAPHADRINELVNPLNELAEFAVADLYDINEANKDDEEKLELEENFYAGFGIGRTIYNAYHMDSVEQMQRDYYNVN